MKGIYVIFGIIIVLIALPFMLTQFTTFQTDSFDDTQTGITTAVGVSAANVTLALPLFADQITNVTHISSNITESSPYLTPAAYDSYSQALTVNGLAEDSTRSLTITYKTDALTAVPGMSATAQYLPFIGILFGVFFLSYILVKRLKG